MLNLLELLCEIGCFGTLVRFNLFLYENLFSLTRDCCSHQHDPRAANSVASQQDGTENSRVSLGTWLCFRSSFVVLQKLRHIVEMTNDDFLD